MGDPFARFAVSVEALAFPKLSFHREGFFVGADGTVWATTGVAEDGGEVVVVEDLLTVRGLSRRFGIAYTETGSNDCCLRDDGVDVFVAVDCLLSSRARDCEATASVTRVSSWGEVGEAALPPLPFLAPLLRRFVVEADLDDVSGPGSATSASSSPS